MGDKSYTWDNFLPWLKKSTAFSPPNRQKISDDVEIPYDAAAWSSEGGPLQVSYPNYRQPFDPYLETAFAKSGLKEIKGLNSGVLDGYSAGTYVIDPRAETRSSSEESFLQDALDTTSLKVYTNTLAHKVLFDGQKAATGVLVETDGGTYTLSAKKEVILSAGVVSALLRLRQSSDLLALVPLSAGAYALRGWSCIAVEGAWHPYRV